MKKRNVLYSLLALVAMGCGQNFSEPVEMGEGHDDKVVVLQERNPDLPTEWSRRRFPKSRAGFDAIPVNQYMGRAYRVGNSILGDIENVSFPVVDIERLKEKYPTYITNDYIRTANVNTLSYATFDRYESQSTVNKKVSSGFSLNLGLFKLGRKKTTTERFHTELIDERESAFGEVEVEVRHMKHEMQTISTARKRIATNFLHPDFLDVLYNTPMQEILDEYGVFVITKYYTGGRASALYYGITKSFQQEQLRETGMNNVINASVVWDTEDTGSGSLEFSPDKDKVEQEIENNNFDEIRYSVTTQGGGYEYEVKSFVGDVAKNELNLTAWFHSLNDENTHVLTGFMDGSLYPIWEFILEENFKLRLNDTHNGYISSTSFEEPFIEIAKVYVRSVGGEKLYKVAPVLHTRHGDLLILNDKLSQDTDAELRASQDEDVFMERAQAIASEKGQYYQCRIEANFSKTITPILRIPLNVDISEFDESRLCKFKNPDTEMWYIYDSGSKVAYSYYFDEYILDMYGMLDWVNSIPEKSISMTSLQQLYRIEGL